MGRQSELFIDTDLHSDDAHDHSPGIVRLHPTHALAYHSEEKIDGLCDTGPGVLYTNHRTPRGISTKARVQSSYRSYRTFR